MNRKTIIIKISCIRHGNNIVKFEPSHQPVNLVALLEQWPHPSDDDDDDEENENDDPYTFEYCETTGYLGRLYEHCFFFVIPEMDSNGDYPVFLYDYMMGDSSFAADKAQFHIFPAYGKGGHYLVFYDDRERRYIPQDVRLYLTNVNGTLCFAPDTRYKDEDRIWHLSRN